MTRTLLKSAWKESTLNDAKFCLKAGGFGRAKGSSRRFVKIVQEEYRRFAGLDEFHRLRDEDD